MLFILEYFYISGWPYHTLLSMKLAKYHVGSLPLIFTKELPLQRERDTKESFLMMLFILFKASRFNDTNKVIPKP